MKEILLGSSLALIVFLIILGINITPILILALLLAGFLYFRQTQGNVQFKDMNNITSKQEIDFINIGGQESAINELKEALEFLIKPEAIIKMGIRPLKGILLVGPPGTGKTLMAKAAANYTKSSFIATSGSEFIEMYAGVGAKRVRKIFNEARKKATLSESKTAIIFIDELEVVGGKRGSHTGHLEYDQTLNQLLVEMDGINSHDEVRVLMIAATNREDMLDPALLRPGRFDRMVQVSLPDKKGRAKILEIHVKNKPVDIDADLEEIARSSFGFSGAHLESLSNEAAILAMREKSNTITQAHFSEAIDKVIMGEKIDRKISGHEIERVSIHESGHALISEIIDEGSVASLTIIPRGKALGFMRKTPRDDHYIYTLEELEKEIKVCLAGAIAEEIRYGNRSTGAKNDYQQAWNLSKEIISSGLSSLGVVSLSDMPQEKLFQECNAIIKKLEIKTKEVLEERRNILYKLAEIMIQEESIDRKRFIELFVA